MNDRRTQTIELPSETRKTPSSGSDSGTPKRPLTALESAWLFIVSDIRNAFPNSDYAKISAEALEETAVSWARLMTAIPIKRIRDVYQATIIGTKFPPTVADFMETWKQIVGDENREYNGSEWKRHDEAVRKALPQGGPGPGRQAAGIHRELGRAVVCKCPPKNGYDWPAKLSPESDGWVCGQQGQPCGFWLPIDQTENAPAPSIKTVMSLAPEVAAVARSTDRAGQSPARRAAIDSGLSVDEMSPEDFMLWNKFFDWWSAKYQDDQKRVCRLTPELMQEHYPIFAAEQKPDERPKPYARFNERQCVAIENSMVWEDWTDTEKVQVQLFNDFACMPQRVIDEAIANILGVVSSDDIPAVQEVYLERYARPTMQQQLVLMPPFLLAELSKLKD